MIIEKHKASVDERCLRAMGLDPETCIYFDIETTGLKAETSHLYLIGYAVRAGMPGDSGSGTWTIVQLFAERTSEEEQVLRRFADICGKYHTVIHFNGDRFDIPYLEEKYREYGMDPPFRHLSTVDIYRKVRPYKKLFQLERLNQKTIEEFLGMRRQDRYDGGQLIGVYRGYRDRLSWDMEGDLRKLMLHNYEDVLGMFSLTQMLAYPLALQKPEDDESGRTDVSASVIRRPVNFDGERRPDELLLSFHAPVPVPVEIDTEEELFRISLHGDVCGISVPVREGQLYHFFEDYRNYYYLPQEDMAVHKSVAQFVDSGHREKAKADNCYIRKTGRFIPVPAKAEFDRGKYPEFKAARKEKTAWIELSAQLEETFRTDRRLAGEYARIILDGQKSVRSKKKRGTENE